MNGMKLVMARLTLVKGMGMLMIANLFHYALRSIESAMHAIRLKFTPD